jgi:hypothetical protein
MMARFGRWFELERTKKNMASPPPTFYCKRCFLSHHGGGGSMVVDLRGGDTIVTGFRRSFKTTDTWNTLKSAVECHAADVLRVQFIAQALRERIPNRHLVMMICAYSTVHLSDESIDISAEQPPPPVVVSGPRTGTVTYNWSFERETYEPLKEADDDETCPPLECVD